MKGFLLIAACTLFTVSSFAQKKISEATISYDIVINTASEKTQAADFLDGATSTVYLKGAKSRVEMVSSLGTQSTIIDGAKNTIAIIKEFGEQKYIINMTPEEYRTVNEKQGNVTFTFGDEEKTILGYKCKKAIGKLPGGGTFTVWYTPDLVTENKEYQNVNRDLPGLAMEYESAIGKMQVTYTVSRISLSPVPASKFDLPRTGYRVMTYKESLGIKQ
jgi:GLPGLI family protein